MNILFLGDIVGNSGCSAVKKFLPKIIKSKKINFVVVNGENAAKEGIGITENIQTMFAYRLLLFLLLQLGAERVSALLAPSVAVLLVSQAST